MQNMLATLCVPAFNHESFIREAIESAFAQTYSPLEIILTDDCSIDKTFQIMQSMAAKYNGPHRVKLNRNSVNLGISRHLQRQIELMSGEFYFGSSGDDISLPHRVEKCMELFRVGGNCVQCVWSNATYINEIGRNIGSYRPADFMGLHNISKPFISMRKHPWVLGATSSYRISLLKEFGPLLPHIVQEDRALAFRATLKGRIDYYPNSLVRYRRHGDNVYNYEKNNCEASIGFSRDLDNKISLARQAMKDAMVAKHRGWINDIEANGYWWSNARIFIIEGAVRHALYGKKFKGKRFAIMAVGRLRNLFLKIDDAAVERIHGMNSL